MFRAVTSLSLGLLAAVWLVGCAPSTKDRLTGKWAGVIEVDKAALDQKLATMDHDNPLAARVLAERLKAIHGGTLDVELKADGTLSTHFKAGNLINQQQVGTWSIKSEEGDKVVLTIVESGNPRDDTLTFVGDELVMDAPGEAQGVASVRFKKQK